MKKYEYEGSYVDPSAKIRCDEFILGKNSYIGPNVVIDCFKFKAGEYLYIPGNVEFGRGGCRGPNSIVEIGNHVGIFEGCVINPSERVTIGDNVGIGAECFIWTHGAWLDVLNGFPSDFGPVTIGKNVWLPARSIVLPNISIGDDVVIGTGSIINRSIPSGSFAAGSPCKVIKENVYPKILSQDQKYDLVLKIVSEWYDLITKHKGIENICVSVDRDLTIHITYQSITCFIDIEKRQVYGDSLVVEDMRDFLRRKGIKIYNGKPFKSLKASYESAF